MVSVRYGSNNCKEQRPKDTTTQHREAHSVEMVEGFGGSGGGGSSVVTYWYRQCPAPVALSMLWHRSWGGRSWHISPRCRNLDLCLLALQKDKGNGSEAKEDGRRAQQETSIPVHLAVNSAPSGSSHVNVALLQRCPEQLISMPVALGSSAATNSSAAAMKRCCCSGSAAMVLEST